MKEIFKNKYLVCAVLASALGSSTTSANLYVEHKRLEWGDAGPIINSGLYDTSRLGYQFDTGVYLEAGEDSTAFGFKRRFNNQEIDLNHEIFDDSNTELTEVKVAFGKPYIQYEQKYTKSVFEYEIYDERMEVCMLERPCMPIVFNSHMIRPIIEETETYDSFHIGYKFDNDSYIELGDSSLEAGFRVGDKNLVIKGSFEVDFDVENLEINPEIQVRYTFAN